VELLESTITDILDFEKMTHAIACRFLCFCTQFLLLKIFYRLSQIRCVTCACNWLW